MINRGLHISLWGIWLSGLKSSISNLNWGQIRGSFLLPMLLITFLLITTSGCDATATDCTSDTFLVTTTEDISDGPCNEHCTLREAVAAANTCTVHDIYPIELPAGTYTLSLRGPGDDRGDLNLTASASIIGVSPATTIIEGDSTWNNRLITIEEGANLHLENISIKDGNLDVGIGGGILNLGVLTLNNVLFENNSAMIGGALYNAGNATLERVEFFRNEAISPPYLSDAEELIYRETEFFDDCGGGFANVGTMVVNEGIVEENQAGDGGGLCNGGGGTLTIRNSSILNNSAVRHSREGGGIHNSGDLTLENSEVTGNTAHNGGGIFQGGPRGDTFDYSDSGMLFLDGVLIQENTAETTIATADVLSKGEGGGLNISGGEFAIQNSSIFDNSARDGGGIHLNSSGYIIYSTIARNHASGHIAGRNVGMGGGIYGEGEVELTNVTFSSNEDDLGGGAAYITGGTFVFFHDTVAYNSAHITGGSVGGIKIVGGRAMIENSLIVGATYCGFSGRGIGGDYPVGINICDRDASPYILSDLTLDNGQWVHVLLASSPAIDRIPSDECPVYDQRGLERPQGDRCDVGAYEFAAMVMSDEDDSIVLSTTPTPLSGSSPDQPTLNTDVLCWEGPGPLYNTVSSVLEGTQVTLLGRGIEGDWWIIDNPRYPGVTCWFPGDALNVDPDLDLTTLMLLNAPPLPTLVQTLFVPTLVTGCLYQGPNDNQASCYPIGQCPVPLNQSLGACTP